MVQGLKHNAYFLFCFICSPGGIPARNAKGERLLLFMGIIDILQSYRLKKKLEHTWKAMIHDGVSTFYHFYLKFQLDHVLFTFLNFFLGYRFRSSARLLRSTVPKLHGNNSI